MIDHPEIGYVQPRGLRYKLGAVSVSLSSKALRDVEIPYDKPPSEGSIFRFAGRSR